LSQETSLYRRIRYLTIFFIFGLVISGITAIPLVSEISLLVRFLGLEGQNSSGATSAFSRWILNIHEALFDTYSKHPELFYGTDWLAFGHIAIAIGFVGAYRDPLRNRWLYDFGLISCLLLIPWALLFGELRQIPFWWRLIDCSFGVFGAIPLLYCRKWIVELEKIQKRIN